MACAVHEPSTPSPPSHWDAFYARPAKPPVAEYMVPYGRIASYLEPEFLRLRMDEARFLIIGCGLSALGEELHDAYGGRMREVMNVDISSLCVEHMRQRSGHRAKMRFAVQDMTRSTLPSAAFEVVIDKGVLDDVLAFSRCAAPDEPQDAGEREACALIWEVLRVLVPAGGVYVIASVHGTDRLGVLLGSPALGLESVEHFDLGGGEVGHHLHVCRARARGPAPDGLGADSSQEQFELYVEDVLHRKYTEAMPLLTAARSAAVREAFRGPGPQGAVFVELPASEVHARAFSAEEQAEYPLEDFLEDLAGFLGQDEQGGGCAAGAAHEEDAGRPCPEPMLSCETFLIFLQAAQ